MAPQQALAHSGGSSQPLELSFCLNEVNKR